MSLRKANLMDFMTKLPDYVIFKSIIAYKRMLYIHKNLKKISTNFTIVQIIKKTLETS